MLALRVRSILQRGSLVELNATQREALNMFSKAIEAGSLVFEDAPCLCGAQAERIISSKDRYGLSVFTRLCKRCGIMRTSPRMTSSSLANFYESYYRKIYVGEETSSDAFFQEQVEHGKLIYDFVRSELGGVDNPLVFDIGCGAGGVLVPFASAHWRVAGCDLGESYLERGRAEGLDLRYGDIHCLRDLGSADVVILSHVLEHFPDPREQLLAIADAMTPAGMLYVEVPGVYEIHRTYGDTMLFLQNAHLYHFTLATLEALLASAGLRLVKGNEIVQALFRKGQPNRQQDLRDMSQSIIRYLWLAEISRICRKNSILRFLCRAGARLLRSTLKRFDRPAINTWLSGKSS